MEYVFGFCSFLLPELNCAFNFVEGKGMAQFVRIGAAPHDWGDLVSDWQQQTVGVGETFDEDYQLQPEIFRPLIDRNDPKAGLFAVFDNSHYEAICQLNTTPLPGYVKQVLRVRHVTFAPRIDWSDDASTNFYSNALVETFYSVTNLARNAGPFAAGHVHFHLPSPADRQFFTFLGQRFKDQSLFNEVAAKGAWLYITL